MKNLTELCEGILDVTSDNFRMGLYDAGYRVVGIESYGGEIIARAITLTGSDFWNNILQKDLAKYGKVKYQDNDFVKTISYNGWRFSVVGSNDPHHTVYDWEPILAIIYEILFYEDWEPILKANVPSGVKIRIDNHNGEQIIHIKKGKWFIKIDIAKK